MKIEKMYLLLFNFILNINTLNIGDILKKSKLINGNLNNQTYNLNNDNLIEIANYERINPEDENYFYIPIIGSSDIHGHFYPEEVEINNISYKKGGLDYLAKYINIIREEFHNNTLYLDAGDIFKGGTESTLTNGDIILEYLNLMNADAVCFGNHEYDYDRKFLEDKIKNAKFPFLGTNIYDTIKGNKKAFGDNHLTSKIFTFKVPENENIEIKIGVIGLSISRTEYQLSGKGYDGITFLDYKNELTSEANFLRKNNKLNAVILLSHIGIECGDKNNLTLNMFKPSDELGECNKDSDLYNLLFELDKGTIDAVVTGHSHWENHIFVNDIPIISPINNGLYSNILYLAFNRKNGYKLEKEKVRIEGPLPICEKIFEKSLKCESVKINEIDKYLPLVEYKFHDVKIEKEPILKPIHDKYDDMYKNFSEIICTLIGSDHTLSIEKNGSYYIGNLVAEIQKSFTGADISISSYGNLRGELSPGKIALFRVKDLIPYKNELCTFSMYGYEVKKMMKIIQSGIKKYFTTSGLKQIFAKNEKGEYFLYDIKYFDGYNEFDLIPEKEYIITANHYLIRNGGDDFSKVLLWYNPRHLNCDYGLDVDLVEKYLRDQEIVDIRKYIDDNNPRIRFID